MANNNRIYYPMQQVAFRKPGTTVYREAHGVQSVAITTTFNLEQAFELGQLAIYENIEGIPNVEVTLNKVLDGYPLLYCLATATNAAGTTIEKPQLVQRAVGETVMSLGIWPETQEAVSGLPSTFCEMSGLTVSSVSYTFPSEGNFTEDLSLAGFNKVWSTYVTGASECEAPWATGSPTGAPSFQDNADAPIGSGGVNQRENMIWAISNQQASSAGGGDYGILPTDIPGVQGSGFLNRSIAHISNVSVSTDFSREDLFELGSRSPYARTVTFSVEVTCSIDVISVSGDLVNALDNCNADVACETPSNLSDQKIRLATCEGTRIYLGEKNKLSSVSYGGGDAGGGNVTVTYEYQTFNDFTVLHSGDNFNTSGQDIWSKRSNYLT